MSRGRFFVRELLYNSGLPEPVIPRKIQKSRMQRDKFFFLEFPDNIHYFSVKILKAFQIVGSIFSINIAVNGICLYQGLTDVFNLYDSISWRKPYMRVAINNIYT